MKNPIKKFFAIPHLFGKLVVIWCIVFGTAASAYALRTLACTGHDPAALLGVILGFFGGELLFLCLRTIMGEKSTKKGKREREETV